MTGPSTRIAAGAVGLIVALSPFASPVARAQDDPGATVQALLDAVEAKDLASIPGFFCAEQAGQANAFDIGLMTDVLPPDVDPGDLLDALQVDVEVEAIETVSQDDSGAVVRLAGTLSLDVDAEPLEPMADAIAEMAGLEADEATMAMFLGILSAELEAVVAEWGLVGPLPSEVALVPGGDRPWLVCSELFGPDATDAGIDGSAGASPGPAGAEGEPSAEAGLSADD